MSHLIELFPAFYRSRTVFFIMLILYSKKSFLWYRFFIWSLFFYFKLLFAHGTNSFLHKPFFDTLTVKNMFAWKSVNFLILFEIVVTNWAKLFFFMFCSVEFRKHIVIFFLHSFWHFSNFVFKLQKLLICHIIRVNIKSPLILHGHYHISEIVRINNLERLI